jgi:hypothetical protein
MAIVEDSENPEIKIDTDTCIYCIGNSACRKSDGTIMTSKEYCEEINTCAATIDWDKIAESREY